MSFPKIRHQKQCEAMALVLIFVLAVGPVYLGMLVGLLTRSIFLGIGVPALCFVLLGRNLFRLDPIAYDLALIFQQIRNEQKVRPAYVTAMNGTDRETIACALQQRLRRFGAEKPTPAGEYTPLCLRYRHKKLEQKRRTVEIVATDCYAVVYSVMYLSEQTYRGILEDAKQRCRMVPLERLSAIYGPAWVDNRARFRLVIILADTVADSVRELALERSHEIPSCWELPCVVECSSHKYYVNLREDVPSFLATAYQAEPVRHCWELPEQILFGGKVPVEPTEPDWIDLDQSLWRLIRLVAAEQELEFGGELPRALRLLRRMKDLEVHLEGNAIFCKLRNHLVVCPCRAEEKTLHLTMGRRWINGEEGSEYRSMPHIGDYDRQEVQSNVEHCLRENGYTVAWEERPA